MGKRPRFSFGEKLLDTYEVADYLQLNHRLVRRLCEAGKIRALRLDAMGEIPKEWRIPFSAVEEYLQNCHAKTELMRQENRKK